MYATMDVSYRHNVEQKKPGTKENIPYNYTTSKNRLQYSIVYEVRIMVNSGVKEEGD